MLLLIREATIKTTDLHKQQMMPGGAFARREVLGYLAASGVAASLWPAFTGEAAEIWEEGDSICAPQQYPALEKPNGRLKNWTTLTWKVSSTFPSR